MSDTKIVSHVDKTIAFIMNDDSSDGPQYDFDSSDSEVTVGDVDESKHNHEVLLSSWSVHLCEKNSPSANTMKSNVSHELNLIACSFSDRKAIVELNDIASEFNGEPVTTDTYLKTMNGDITGSMRMILSELMMYKSIMSSPVYLMTRKITSNSSLMGINQMLIPLVLKYARKMHKKYVLVYPLEAQKRILVRHYQFREKTPDDIYKKVGNVTQFGGMIPLVRKLA